jgi:hypothetical protein
VRLPFALKGVDVIIYAVFRSLGLKVKIRPVLEDIEEDYGYHRRRGESDEEERYLVGTGLHCMKLSERGGYDNESPAEVRPDPSASPCRAHHIGRLLKGSGLRRSEAISSG